MTATVVYSGPLHAALAVSFIEVLYVDRGDVRLLEPPAVGGSVSVTFVGVPIGIRQTIMARIVVNNATSAGVRGAATAV